MPAPFILLLGCLRSVARYIISSVVSTLTNNRGSLSPAASSRQPKNCLIDRDNNVVDHDARFRDLARLAVTGSPLHGASTVTCP